jgi:hypothetical protein
LEAGESIKSCFERLTKEGQITGGIRGVDFLVAVWAKGNGRDEM